MKKNLLDLDLQLFAEEVEDTGANEVEETATPEEEETSEEETVETGETEEDGNAEPEQTPEENARYAAIRRRAEEEARKRYESEIGQLNQRVAAMCASVDAKHPTTGQPITNVNDYFDALSIQQRQRDEAVLQEKGIDPQFIDRMVASNPAVLQAQIVMEQMKQQEAAQQVQRDLEEIMKLDPTIKGYEDLAPYANELVAYCQQHNATLTDAYKILHFNNLISNNNDAARQQAINQMRGKSHLPSQTQSVETGNDDDVEVPAEIMARFKADGKTEKQIKELYKRVPH